MARTVTVIMTDDIDGSPDAQTVTFGYQGQQFEIDLAEKNHVAFLTSLQPFIKAAHIDSERRRPRRGAAAGRPSPAAPSADRSAVRAWAEAQGLQVAARGRISAEVLEKYQAAH
jgi:Lsr2